jgi:hypothetical protein
MVDNALSHSGIVPMTAPMHQPEPDCYRWAPGVVFSASYHAGRDDRPTYHPYSDAAEDAAKAANVWLAMIPAGRRKNA